MTFAWSASCGYNVGYIAGDYHYGVVAFALLMFVGNLVLP